MQDHASSVWLIRREQGSGDRARDLVELGICKYHAAFGLGKKPRPAKTGANLSIIWARKSTEKGGLALLVCHRHKISRSGQRFGLPGFCCRV
jgi:hypothetical protein